MIVLLALAWAVVLVPSALRPRFESSPITGVREFERSMGILASARSTGKTPPGRWVMVPKGMGAPPVTRRARVMLRRRRIFERLVIAAAATFFLGIIPPLRVVWMAHAAIDVVLVAYVVQLRRWHVAEAERQAKVRRIERQQTAAPPVATVRLDDPITAPVPVVRLDDDEVVERVATR